MFNFFKKKDQKKPIEHNDDSMYDFKWFEIGEQNPFNKRILDIRPFTQHMTSTTKDPAIATLFVERRAGVGKEYIDFEFVIPTSVDVQLSYSHNGEKIEGAGYKAREMEDKWDVYAWNNIIYFVRSWTGEVCYKAFITYDQNAFIIHRIELNWKDKTENDRSLAINNVHFLVLTLLFKSIQPHQIPQHLKTNQEIAGYSFSLFGRNCWYATYEDITDIKKLSGTNN